MTEQHEDAPKLIFFRGTPKDLLSHPPLASSLQHLETSLLLIALRRYPHALVSCASALESAIKAAFKSERNQRFEKLLMEAQHQISPAMRLEHRDLDDFRKKRNEIIHRGFSPKDDETSAVLLLRAGIPFIDRCYVEFFDFYLKRYGRQYGGLLPDLDRHLGIAQTVYSKARGIDGVNLTYCFLSLAHDIRWGISHWMLSDWQMNTLEKEEGGDWSSWEFKEKQKTHLEGKLGATWRFNCPICEEADTFVVALEDRALGEGEIRLTRGACVNCSFVIPAGCPFLADELCMDQIGEATAKILKEYGIARH